MSKNKSSGIHLLNFSKSDLEEKYFTLVVSGLGRSGTTMVAKMLTSAGIFMSVAKGDIIHEDIHLASLIENGDDEKARQYIENRNAAHQVWGFKRPLIVDKAQFLERLLRNPRYIIIFRDPLAVSMRNMKSMNFTLESAMNTYFIQMEIIRDFVKANKRPLLLMSYEKVIFDPEYAAKRLAQFCRIEQSQIENMVTKIQPNDKEYLEKTKAASS